MSEPLRSLRRRLLVILSLPLFAMLAVSMIVDYRSALSIASEARDEALVRTAIALVSRLERDDDDKDIEVDIPPAADAILRADTVDRVRYVVFDDHRRIVAGDGALLALPPPTVDNTTVLADGRLDDTPVRMASYRYVSSAMVASVIVAETTVKRSEAAARILMAIVWPNLLLIVAALLLVYFGVKYALRPLDALGHHIDRRGPNDFSPLDEGRVPEEARPLVRAINRLMQHLCRAGRTQQAFLSNAAHQLRTPLAGLHTQLELATQTAPPAMQPRMKSLLDAVQRLSHFTHQMLALARSSSESAVAADHRPVDLDVLLGSVAAEFLAQADAAGIDLGCDTAPCPVEGSAWMLREVAANLFENALRYAGPHAHVTGRCGFDEHGQPFLEVDDDGPGIPEAERDKVLDRFYRARGTPGEGTGLGLAIVKEVAERHDARVEILGGRSGRGTCVRIVFPAAAAPRS